MFQDDFPVKTTDKRKGGKFVDAITLGTVRAIRFGHNRKNCTIIDFKFYENCSEQQQLPIHTAHFTTL